MRLTAGRAVEVIAHRGASAYRPEHTCAAYDLALAQGADALELDLRATADGQVVVVHDATLDRTHGDPRAVAVVRLAELEDGARPLTLAEVLQRYEGRARLLLELKGPRGPVEAVVAQVAAAGAHDRVVLQSFDLWSLWRARALDRSLALASLHVRRPPARRLIRLGPLVTGIGIPHAQVDAALVAAAHARGLRVRAYTPNDPGDLARLVACGVDGLITDVPDEARRIVSATSLAA